MKAKLPGRQFSFTPHSLSGPSGEIMEGFLAHEKVRDCGISERSTSEKRVWVVIQLLW